MKRVAVVLLMLGSLVGCGNPRPPNAVALSLYARNLSTEPFAFSVVGSHTPAIVGELGGPEPRSYGCGWVGNDWLLVVAEGTDPPDPAQNFTASTGGEDHGGRNPVAIWMEAQPDGEVVIGEGVPSWWTHEEQHC